jgi:hypothetical protein
MESNGISFCWYSLTKPDEIADVFSKHFQSVYSNTPSGFLQLPFSLSSDSLALASVNDDGVSKTMKRLGPTKCVGLHDIPNFVVKGCSEFLLLY